MECGHHFPVGIKGQFFYARHGFFQRFTVDIVPGCQFQQRQFRRIPYIFSLGFHSIIAEAHAGEKFQMHLFIQALGGNGVLVAKAAYHAHFILGERTCFIRAYDADRAQCFNGRQFPDNGMYLYHTGYTEGETDGHDGRQPFRHGSDGKGNGRNQHIKKIPVLQNADGKQQSAEEQRKNTQQSAQFAQAFLQGCQFLFGIPDHRCDFPDFRMQPGGGDNAPAPAIGDDGGHIGHVDPVAQRDFAHLFLHGEGSVFIYGQRFSGQR